MFGQLLAAIAPWTGLWVSMGLPSPWKYGLPTDAPPSGYKWEYKPSVGQDRPRYRAVPVAAGSQYWSGGVVVPAITRVIAPMVQEGIVKEEEIGAAGSAMAKLTTAPKSGAVVLTPKERAVVEKMGPELKKKKSALRWIVPAAIGVKLLRMFA